ncbi:MAG: hypothetical protein P4L48_24660 [Mycobacterium sp.]|nr:hypothetical protein [Mycobacterium sp.]
MKLVADSGLWTTAPTRAAPPLIAVLEVSGAVLSWIVDEPPGGGAGEMTFTDLARADWLWRLVGESGHVAVVSALEDAAITTQPSRRIDLAGVNVAPGSVDALRRLAVGHWLRRWWPASRQDGIPRLDRALLDVEIALLTAAAQSYFSDDTFDSDVTELLSAHGSALAARMRGGDPRVLGLARAAAGLADEVGVDDPAWADLSAALQDSSAIPDLPSGRRDDYALAAGAGGGARGATEIARGVASIRWSAVPPGIFDAGENTVEWNIEVADAAVLAVVRVAIIGPGLPTGIAVQLRSGAFSCAGALDADGRAVLPLVDAQGQPVTESAAWDHDWSVTSVDVGAPLSEATETPEARERLRRWARARLDRPADDAFLAEILAAESAY